MANPVFEEDQPFWYPEILVAYVELLGNPDEMTIRQCSLKQIHHRVLPFIWSGT